MKPIQSLDTELKRLPPGSPFVRLKTEPRTPGTSNKSLGSYSLRVTRGERQRVAPNGHNRGLNGKPGHLTAIVRVPKVGLLVVRLG